MKKAAKKIKNIVIGNLKMNLLSSKERDKYISLTKKEAKAHKLNNTEILLCVPHIHLEGFTKQLKGVAGVQVGVQNIFWEEKGSYTGEASPLVVKNYGGKSSIIGHSERVKYFEETVEMFNLKIKAALRSGLFPIYCVGETKNERNMEITGQVIKRQVKEGLKGLSPSEVEKVVVVYEPVWSVGNDKVPTTDEIMSAGLIIRKELTEMFGEKTAKKVRLGYGGSVNKDIVRAVCIDSGLDGALIGRESLSPKDFFKIAEIIDKGKGK